MPMCLNYKLLGKNKIIMMKSLSTYLLITFIIFGFDLALLAKDTNTFGSALSVEGEVKVRRRLRLLNVKNKDDLLLKIGSSQAQLQV